MAPVTNPAARVEACSRFDFESPEFRVLFAGSTASAFQAPDWLSPFYRDLVPALAAEPLIVVAHVEGRLACVLPLIRRRIGELAVIEAAALGVSDYACPVVDPTVAARFDRAAIRNALMPFDALDVGPVRSDALVLWSSLVEASAMPLAMGAHALGPGDRQIARRRDAARKWRQLARLGPLRLETVPAERIAAVFAAARRLRAGRFAGDPLQAGPTFDFYEGVARAGAVSGFARTWCLYCGDDLVGLLFGIICGRRFCYLILTCDYGRYGRWSPGMVLFEQTMEQWFATGGEVFDFTIGDESFKAALGCTRTPLFRLVHALTPRGAAFLERASAR